MDCEKNTDEMTPNVVSKKNTHAMTLVDSYVVCEKNTHAMTLVVVSKNNTHAMTLVESCVVSKENTHFNDTAGAICGM